MFLVEVNIAFPARHSTKNIRNNESKWNITGLKIPTGRRQPVGHFTSVAEDLNSGRPRTNPASGQSGTRIRHHPDDESDKQTTQPRYRGSGSTWAVRGC